MSIAFKRMATVMASTKRAPAMSSAGKVGEPVLKIPAMACTPLDPVNTELAQRLAVDTPHTLLQCFADGALLDVLNGDFLVVNDRSYPIKSVAPWVGFGGRFIHLVVEDLKR